MTLALWIVNAILALLFLYAGATKLFTRKETLLARDEMAWAESYSPAALSLIGLAEILGAVGLVLPLATGMVRMLAPVAAGGLLIVMIGAIAVHRGRREPTALPIGLALMATASLTLGLLAAGGSA